MVVQFGPIQLVVINLGHNDSFDAEIVMELIEVSQDGQGTIRLMDALLLRHDNDGGLSYIEVTDFGEGQTGEVGAIIDKLIDMGAETISDPEARQLLGALTLAERDYGLSEEQIYAIAADITPGTATLVLLFEHSWAKQLKAAITRAGGVMLAQGFISPEALLKVGPELARAVAASKHQ